MKKRESESLRRLTYERAAGARGRYSQAAGAAARGLWFLRIRLPSGG